MGKSSISMGHLYHRYVQGVNPTKLRLGTAISVKPWREKAASRCKKKHGESWSISISAWWYTYPSEKNMSRLGILFSIYDK